MANRTPLFVRKQAGGVFTIADALRDAGNIWWVHSGTGTDAVGYGVNPDAPFATLAYAVTQATASVGEVIVAMAGHAETTHGVALSKAGIRIIGQGFGANRPTFTATTDADDLFAVSAANVRIENIRLLGAASGNTALMDLTAAATDFVAERCEFVQAATPLEGITISADRFRFTDCVFRGSADGPDRCFSIEARSNDWVIEGCRFLYRLGLDNEIIKSVKQCLGYLIKDVFAVGLDTLVVNFASSSAGPPDGLFTNGNVMYSAAVTSIEDGVAAGTTKGVAFGRLYATDVTGKASGLIPLTTAS